jgi:uncharacterized protein YidB (DUF937 family)
MGFLDVIRGMQNGPGGAPVPSSQSGGGMSPITMALMGLLAYKAWKSHSASNAANNQMAPAPSSGGLGDVLGGLFGGRAGSASAMPGGMAGWLGSAMAGGSLGGVLGDGLRKLVTDMQANGASGQAQSWVGTGPNQDISQSDLAKAIGSEDIDRLSQQTGLPRDQLLSQLQTELPAVVDELTPNGRVPTHDESAKWI